jgi:hypothetical protein
VIREPAVTFRGALRILGHHDRRWVDRLDRLLGGVILGTGVATVTEAAVFGWADQKNEATGLLRTALGTISNRLLKTGGLARHELVIAAHTTIVLAAFWEILAAYMGPGFRLARFTAAEKVRLGTGTWQQSGEHLVRHLFEADVPAPSSVKGFEENVADVRAWAEATAGLVHVFLRDLAGTPVPFVGANFPDAVAARYSADYLVLAAKVPEFKVWTDLGEHAATRSALSRLENLLAPRAQEGPRPRLRAQLREINRAELSRRIIDVDIDGYGIDTVFPAVQDIFVDPNYLLGSAHTDGRLSAQARGAEPGKGQRGNDLVVVLARHFSAADATRVPFLVLGHPGAGKSLLTKVLAARLPEPTYTVVRVPLRRVNADANVVEQIQQGLLLATNGTVTWPELAKECDDVIRVVVLDGLDELLQATTNDRGGYLADVMEFQRVEAALGRPVAVIVTSRTLVADRIRVPRGTPVVELLEFDDAQIAEWITTWNAVNSNIRPMTPKLADAYADLARQPLLLLMLTLYFTDPNIEPPDHDLSTAELYQRLLNTYVRREVTKQAGRVLPDEEYAEAVHTRLTRLAVAALGMFNRGRLSITEAELTADLIALGESAPTGRRVLSEFYFVHAPEAGDGDHRGYEFLHTTFMEYLVATRVVEVLAEVAEGSFGRRRFHEPDDGLLFALLSHQPLAIQNPILDFVADGLAALDDAERVDVIKTLDLLISAYRGRVTSTKYLSYRPSSWDAIRELAAYSANLVLVRVLADRDGVHLGALFPGGSALSAWDATVRLWSAGLDIEGFRTVISAMVLTDREIAVLRRREFNDDTRYYDNPSLAELNAAVLRGDDETARRLRFGHVLLDVQLHQTLGGSWEEETLGALLNHALGYPARLTPPPAHASKDDMLSVTETAYRTLGSYSVYWGRDTAESFLRWLLELPMPYEIPAESMALVNEVHADLLRKLRDDPQVRWSPDAVALLNRAIANPPDGIGGVRDYLRSVQPPSGWRLPFIEDDRSFPLR